MARPSKYNQQIANKILGLISEGNSLREICKSKDMPSEAAVYRWLNKLETFRSNYVRACEDRTEVRVEQIAEIEQEMIREVKECDDSKLANALVQAYKQKIDDIKWIASKLKNKKYGDRLALAGDDSSPLQINFAVPRPGRESAQLPGPADVKQLEAGK